MKRRPLVELAQKHLGSLRKPSVQGFVDAVGRGDWIEGWAWAPRRPQRRLEVVILEGNDIIGATIANVPRKDLQAANIGDGCYGFRIRPNTPLLPGATRQVRICALTERGRVLLRRGEITLGAEQSPAVTASSTSAAKMGALDRLEGRKLHGWAFNPQQPDIPVVVDIYDDERFLGSTTADRSRPRLRERGFPPGVRGFVFELPQVPDAEMLGRIRARLAGTNYEFRPVAKLLEPEVALSPDAEHGDAEPATKAAQTHATDAAPPRTPSPAPDLTAPAPLPPLEQPLHYRDQTVALVVAGGDTALLPETVSSWTAQDHSKIALAISGVALDLPSSRLEGEVLWAGGDAAADLGAFLGRAEFACFGRPGDVFLPELAATLASLPGFPDMVVWDGGVAPVLESFLLTTPLRGFAIRTAVLARYPGDLAAELAQGFLLGIRAWAATQPALRWQSIALPKSAETGGQMAAGETFQQEVLARALPDWHIRVPAPVGSTFAWPSLKPQSLTLALWRGFETNGLPGLVALLAEPFDGAIEILVPTGGDEETGKHRMALAQDVMAGRPGMTCRMIDAAGCDAEICAALLRSATHEALVLADAGLVLPGGSLGEILAWALHPQVGLVGCDAAEAGGARLAGGVRVSQGHLAPSVPATAQLVDAVSLRFMACATRKLFAAGGLDIERFPGPFAALELGLRLKRFGQTSLVLGTVVASAAAGVPADPDGALPWQVAALLQSGALLSAA